MSQQRDQSQTPTSNGFSFPGGLQPVQMEDSQKPKSSHHKHTTSAGSRRTMNGRLTFDGGSVHPILSARTRKESELRSRSWDIDDYFSGPLDPSRHSKLPFFVRIHGSILPKMIIPLFFVVCWSTTIVVITKYVVSLGVDSVLLTVLGFVVGLALSFRTSTAYERYQEGRKYWALLTLHSRQLAHIIWTHCKERPETEKEDILLKLSAINLILAFAQACKHKLRHEIEYDYTDLKPLIGHLDTFAKAAHSSDSPARDHNRSVGKPKNWGEYLDIPWLTPNPRMAYKIAARSGTQHGNLPSEIVWYLGQFVRSSMDDGMLDSTIMQGQIYNSFNNLMDAYGGCDRVLQTPLPLAFNIAISQITWLYVLTLPFQLAEKLGWVTIPGTIVAAYIILGLAAIGREIENPFGRDVNDLDLDRYCNSLQYDLNVLTSRPGLRPAKQWMGTDENQPLWPYSVSGWGSWKSRSVAELREALANKVTHQAAVLHGGGLKSGEREKSKEAIEEV